MGDRKKENIIHENINIIQNRFLGLIIVGSWHAATPQNDTTNYRGKVYEGD